MEVHIASLLIHVSMYGNFLSRLQDAVRFAGQRRLLGGEVSL
jgi:hypothetical protein